MSGRNEVNSVWKQLFEILKVRRQTEAEGAETRECARSIHRICGAQQRAGLRRAKLDDWSASADSSRAAAITTVGVSSAPLSPDTPARARKESDSPPAANQPADVPLDAAKSNAVDPPLLHYQPRSHPAATRSCNNASPPSRTLSPRLPHHLPVCSTLSTSRISIRLSRLLIANLRSNRKRFARKFSDSLSRALLSPRILLGLLLSLSSRSPTARGEW